MAAKKTNATSILFDAELKRCEARRDLIETTRKLVKHLQEDSLYQSSGNTSLLHELQEHLSLYDRREKLLRRAKSKMLAETFALPKKPPTRATSSASPRSSAPAKSRSKSSAPSTKPPRPKRPKHKVLAKSRGQRPKYLSKTLVQNPSPPPPRRQKYDAANAAARRRPKP